MEKIEGVTTCVFDAYGTIFDVHSAVRRNRERVGSEADEVSRMWRIKQLEYSWLRSLMGRYVDLWQITQEALDYAMAKANVLDTTLRDDLLNAYMSLDAYPEVEGVLSTLRDAGMMSMKPKINSVSKIVKLFIFPRIIWQNRQSELPIIRTSKE